MSKHGSSRRDFLRTAGVSAAGFGVGQFSGGPGGGKTSNSDPASSPFPSLGSIFEAPRSKFFGVKTEERFETFGDGRKGHRLKLVPRDPKTYYLADGLSGEEEPHSFQLTFEITNNSIVCSATQTGLLKNPCVFARMAPARRRGREFESQELAGGSAWAFGLMPKGGRPIRFSTTHGAQVELLGSVFPLFSYLVDDLSIQLLVFAPRYLDSSKLTPRAILAVLRVRSRGTNVWEGSLLAPGLNDPGEEPFAGVSTPAESPHPRLTELQIPIAPGYEAGLS
ncbi:MAG: twin-arginine translocation signal domain-containing protein, partial [Acidobacteria bacterium]